MNNNKDLQDDSFFINEEQDKSNYFLLKIISKWPFFLLSIIVCVLLAFFYIKYSTPIYTIDAKIFIKDDESKGGGGINALSGLSDLFNTTSKVDNEAQIIQTRYLMEKVVKDLKLDITYQFIGHFRDVELTNPPFIINFLSKRDTVVPNTFKLKFREKNIIIFNDSYSKSVSFNQKFVLDGIGVVEIVRNNGENFANGQYSFSVENFDTRVASYMKALTVAVPSKEVSIIDLTFNYPNKKKGEDILNQLIQVYQQENLNDKNKVADSTIAFITERLTYVESELGNVEGSIQTFRENSKLADMTEQGKLLVQNSSEYVDELGKTTTQIAVLDDLSKYLQNGDPDKRVFPSGVLPDGTFGALITRYNALIVDRERQLLSTTVDNPFIKNLDLQIAGLRQDMLANLTSTRQSLLITKQNTEAKIKQLEGQVQGVPQKERTFLDLERQQQIKQDLYVFLMQKREETAISKTSNISNSRVIDPPKADDLPISPVKKFIYFIALFVGLLIPLACIYGADLLKTQIMSKEDISRNTSVPILGEISKESSREPLVVTDNSRTAISEQFRSLRTNLHFFLDGVNEKVILITSSMSGEGKSFTAVNLGMVLAITGKRVLLMEMDLRKPNLSNKLGTKSEEGFTNYVISSAMEIEKTISQSILNENLFIMSSGPIPPNPTEIILNDRVPELMENLRSRFDYIIMDTPPIGLVTDAQLLSKYSDMTIYIVRHKFTHKQQLSIVENLHQSKKMAKMCIVVNDIAKASSTYGYGYSYGYGYGYGYYEDETKKNKLWWQKILFRNK